MGDEAALALRECLAAYLPSPLAGPMLRQRIAVDADAPVDVLAVAARPHSGASGSPRCAPWDPHETHFDCAS